MLTAVANIEAQLSLALEAAHRETLLDHVRQNPDVSLGDLMALGNGLGDLAAGLTVREILTGSPAAPKAARKTVQGKRSGKTRKGASRRRGGAAETRTAGGRAAYDGAVLAAVRAADGDVKADALISTCGGTPLQLRTALHRLIELKQIARKGRARATVYRAK